VIVKAFDSQEDESARQLLRAERNAILQVQQRCGSDITPNIVGLYFLEGFDAGVMIMEDGGDNLSVKETFDRLSKGERWELSIKYKEVMLITYWFVHREAIWNILLTLHKNGISHDDVKLRNFVKDREGRIRVVDFGNADLEHECDGLKDCYELKKAAAALNLSS
jgi:serine/threonine protein kinase